MPKVHNNIDQKNRQKLDVLHRPKKKINKKNYGRKENSLENLPSHKCMDYPQRKCALDELDENFLKFCHPPSSSHDKNTVLGHQKSTTLQKHRHFSSHPLIGQDTKLKQHQEKVKIEITKTTHLLGKCSV